MGGLFTLGGIESLKEEWPDIHPDIVYDLLEEVEYRMKTENLWTCPSCQMKEEIKG